MNSYGAKAKAHLMEYCPAQYMSIKDKEAYFTELGNEAERQASSVYSKIAIPELGQNDEAARQMANETVNELIYPTPEEGSEDGWAEEQEEDWVWEDPAAASRMKLDGLLQSFIDEGPEEETMSQLRQHFPDAYARLA